MFFVFVFFIKKFFFLFNRSVANFFKILSNKLWSVILIIVVLNHYLNQNLDVQPACGRSIMSMICEVTHLGFILLGLLADPGKARGYSTNKMSSLVPLRLMTEQFLQKH